MKGGCSSTSVIYLDCLDFFHANTVSDQVCLKVCFSKFFAYNTSSVCHDPLALKTLLLAEAWISHSWE